MITVNFTGLEPIAEALNNLAKAIGAAGFVTTVKGAEPLQQPARGQTVTAPVVSPAAPTYQAAPTSPAIYQTPVMQTPTVQASPVQSPAPAASVAPQPAPAVQPAPAIAAAPQPAPTYQAVPTTAVPQGYTQDQLAVAMTGLVDQGKMELVMQILAAFGAPSLMQVPKERYADLALELRKAGASI